MSALLDIQAIYRKFFPNFEVTGDNMYFAAWLAQTHIPVLAGSSNGKVSFEFDREQGFTVLYHFAKNEKVTLDESATLYELVTDNYNVFIFSLAFCLVYIDFHAFDDTFDKSAFRTLCMRHNEEIGKEFSSGFSDYILHTRDWQPKNTDCLRIVIDNLLTQLDPSRARHDTACSAESIISCVSKSEFTERFGLGSRALQSAVAMLGRSIGSLFGESGRVTENTIVSELDSLNKIISCDCFRNNREAVSYILDRKDTILSALSAYYKTKYSHVSQIDTFRRNCNDLRSLILV